MTQEVFLLPIPAEQLLLNLRWLENAYTLVPEFSILNTLCSSTSSV